VAFEMNPRTNDEPIDYREYLSIIGRKGGKAKTPAKIKASRENGKLGGRKRKAFRGAKS
jgi:hypothetical protein